MSAPATNDFSPEPVMTTTLTLLSSLSSSSALTASACTCLLRAFSLSGRLMVRTATAPLRSTLIVSKVDIKKHDRPLACRSVLIKLNWPLARLFVHAFNNIVVGDPGNEQSQPVIFRFRNGNADSRSAVICCRNSHHLSLHFNWYSVRSVRTDVQNITIINLLIKLKQSAQRRNIVCFGGLTPGS